MSTKTHAKAYDGTGESAFVVQHEAIEVVGKKSLGLADAGVVASKFDGAGLYIVEDATTGDAAVISAIKTAGTLSVDKVAGPTVITTTKDTASSVNVYVEGGFITGQNLTGGSIDLVIKPFV